MAKNNMGIADQEFSSGAAKLSNYAAALDSQIQAYLSAVNTICQEGIQDQLVRAKLIALCEQVQSIREPLNSIVSQAAQDCKAFITAVDEADQFLY